MSRFDTTHIFDMSARDVADMRKDILLEGSKPRSVIDALEIARVAMMRALEEPLDRHQLESALWISTEALIFEKYRQDRLVAAAEKENKAAIAKAKGKATSKG